MTGLQWEDYLFELQNAVEWRMVMWRGQDERSQMHAMSLAIVARLDILERCADNGRNLLASQVPRAAVARVLSKAARAAETQTSAIVVDRSVIDDLIALVGTRVAVSVASVDI